MLDWLNQNGYTFPAEKENILEYYVWLSKQYKPYYFVANKINLENKYPGLQISEESKECVNAMNLEERALYDPVVTQEIEWYVENETWWRKIKSGERYKEYYERQYAGREVKG